MNDLLSRTEKKVKNYQVNCHHYWNVSVKYDQIKLLFFIVVTKS